MLTIKLVVIGASGVGKTSLRGQYISSQFSTGYRATIGADFISKTLPHPRIPGESITLQIWDTAGQERFASLASAFYRGADAVLLMFDVNRPETLAALHTWWLHFCAHAPLEEEDMGRFCVVVVGNKMDLVGTEHGAPEAVSPAYAWEVIREMMPALIRDCPAANSVVAHTQLCEDPAADIDGGADAAPSESIAIHSQRRISHLRAHSRASSRFSTGTMTSMNTVRTVNTIYHTPASSLSTDTDIFHSARTSPEHSISLSHSHSRASRRFDTGTMTSMGTVNTIYHTPASSLFTDTDIFHSARTSPEHSLSHSSSSSSSSHSPSPSPSYSPFPISHPSSSSSWSYSWSLPLSSASLPLRATSPNSSSTRARRNTAFSTSSVSSDGATITPGMLSTPTAPQGDTPTNPHPNTTTTNPNPSPPSPATPSGPRLFYTSAKTGAGVGGVFEVVAAQVVGRWACEEVGEVGEVGRMDVRDASEIKRGGIIKRGRRWGTVEVGAPHWKGAQKGSFKKGAGCCA